MKAVKKQYVMIKIGKELKWAKVINKSNGLYKLELIMNHYNDTMPMTCTEDQILAVSDINITVLEKDIELGLK